MSRFKQAAASMIVGVLVFSAVAVANAAPATTCDGSLTGGTYERITVPNGATCTLTDVTVTHQVQARFDSALFVFSSDLNQVHGLKAEIVRIFDSAVSGHIHIHHGNVNDPQLSDIVVQGSTVGGNIHIHHNVGTIRVQDTQVGGHIQIQHNRSHLVIVDNVVGKNLQVMKTTGDDDKDVTGNAVGGQLHCRHNAAPFNGGPNASASKVHGDCFVA